MLKRLIQLCIGPSISKRHLLVESPVCVVRTLELVDERLTGQHDVLLLVASFLGVKTVSSLEATAANGTSRDLARVQVEPGDDPALQLDAYTKAFRQAIMKDDLQIIKRLHNLHRGPVAIDTLTLAMGHATLKTVQWLARHRSDCRCSGPLTPSKERRGRACCFRWNGANVHAGEAARILRWLVKCEWIRFSKVCVKVVEEGDVETLRWLLGDSLAARHKTLFRNAVVIAASAGSLPIVQFLHEKGFYTEEELEIAWSQAVAFGYDSVASYLLGAHAGCRELHRDTAIWAAERGNLAVLHRPNVRRWLAEDEVMERAALATYEHGHLPVLQWLFAQENGGPNCLRLVATRQTTCHHRESQRLAILQWIEQEGMLNGELAAGAIADAARDGFLFVLQWLNSLNRFSHLFTCQQMDDAASGGHLGVVRWLHSNRCEGCTVEAMNRASANGHLDVVIFLHKNRSEGCSTKAMDRAPLHVLQWLHSHRSEGCTTAAAWNAVRRGDLDVLRFLATDVGVKIDFEVGFEAYQQKHSGIVTWLQKYHPSAVHTPRTEQIRGGEV